MPNCQLKGHFDVSARLAATCHRPSTTAKAQDAARSHAETRQESCSNLAKLGELLFGFYDTMDLFMLREKKTDGFYDILNSFRKRVFPVLARNKKLDYNYLNPILKVNTFC